MGAAWSLTPNDLAAFSNLVALPAAASHLRFGGPLWALCLVLAAAASFAYHGAETVRHDLGSHDMPGAQWAHEVLTPHEDLLLRVDRACAVLAGAATTAASGGPRHLVSRLLRRRGVLSLVMVGLAALLASDFAGITGWCYAVVHSAWHVAAFLSAGFIVQADGDDYDEVSAAAPADLLVVGLGNPGMQYVGTRHNIGADVIEKLAHRAGASLSPAPREHARAVRVQRGTLTIVFAKPDTYMNRSGRSVAALCQAHSINEGARIVVVHDELDLPPGRLKLKQGGGGGSWCSGRFFGRSGAQRFALHRAACAEYRLRARPHRRR